MATMVGKQKDIASLLNALIELDFDAVEAYEAAIERLDSLEDKNQLSVFMADHQRHVRDLQPLVEELGEKPAQKADMKQILAKGKVVLASLLSDRVILLAMRSNEDDTNLAYERAVARNDLPQHVQLVLARNLEDERRHREYIVRRLAIIDAAEEQPVSSQQISR